MILPIVAYGHPVLKKEAEPIDKEYPHLTELIADMFQTMYHAHGVGLAAPQVGKSIRLFVVDGSPFADEPGDEPDPKAEGLHDFKRVFINPTIEEQMGEEWAFNEGCLSIPKIREEVFRRETIQITYYDQEWNFHRETLAGYKARIVQHEYDHIQGILFTDHLSALKKKMITKRLQSIAKGDIKVDYSMRFPSVKKTKK